MARVKFLCDADRCIECNACVTACKNEHEVPWGINRRRVVTINDGKPGERSVSMACMHCTDAPCAAVCPVSCFYTTADGVVLHSKDLCIGCGYCFYACPFGAPQYPKVGNFGSRGKMDKCTYCAGGPEADSTPAEYAKYGANRLAEGKLPICAEMCSTKSLLAGDGAIIAEIYKERVMKRGYGSGMWGWKTAYAIHRPADATAAALRRGGARVTLKTERALCKCQAHFQLSSCPLQAAVRRVRAAVRVRASRGGAAFLQAHRRSRPGRQAPECAERGRQDHRPDLHSRHDGLQPDPARRPRLARFPAQQAADHRRRRHSRDAGAAGDLPDGARPDPRPPGFLRAERSCASPASSASPTG